MDYPSQLKLERMRRDFRSVTGQGFSWFYCPVLFRDEDNVELCKAHIVNDAFENSPRTWTLQRKDVDNFYGSHFEADFINLQYQDSASPDECLVSKDLAKKIRPEIRLKGNRVDYYVARENLPSHHTGLVIETSVGSVQLGLKIRRNEIAAAGPEDWEISVEKDLRVPALVSLIKAAHLTLFEMLGYRYTLSAGGHFTGWDVLGKFFTNNHNRRRDDVLKNAGEQFAEFKNMVRPVDSDPLSLDGTNSDGKLYICESSGIRWAFIIFVRTSHMRHAVLIPILEQAEGAARFFSFLKSESATLEARFTIFENGNFLASPQTALLPWPKADLL